MSYYLDKNQVVAELKSNVKNGLTADKVIENRKKYGENVLEKPKGKSIFKRILEALLEPMIIILLFACCVTLGTNIGRLIGGKDADFIESIGIIFAIILSTTITVVMEGKSHKAFEKLNEIEKRSTTKAIRDGNVIVLTQADIVVGDILLLEAGDKVVADGRVIESNELLVDESHLTGETHAVTKSSDKKYSKNTPMQERLNMVYSGSYVLSGNAKVIVTAVGKNSMLGEVAEELKKERQENSPLQEKIKKLGAKLTIISSVCAGLVFVIGVIKLIATSNFTFLNLQETFISCIVLIVAAVPEGLPTIIAISLSLSVIKMSKQNALVKKLVACETIGCISVICTDKTGTLTKNEMTVETVYSNGIEEDMFTFTNEHILNNICLNSTANLKKEKGKFAFIGNPTECALLVLNEKNKRAEPYKKVRENALVLKSVPFSSSTKIMTTVVTFSGQNISYVKGAPEIVLEKTTLSTLQKNTIVERVKTHTEQGKRVIAFAHKVVSDLSDKNIDGELIFDGFAVICDSVREDVAKSIKECKKAGINVIMLTGDSLVTAKAIAREVGILKGEYSAVEGRDIDKLTDEELKHKLSYVKVIARSTPLIKLRVVNALKELGEVVAVTGDGINDAPALKSADVGISMGITGTEVSKEASDLILLNDSFSTIVKAVKWGRGMYDNFRRFILFQLSVNVSALLTIVASLLFGFDSPFTALQLLWINIIMDGPPALTLGLEKQHKDLMTREPIRRDASLVGKKMLVRIMINGIYVAGAMLLQLKTNFLKVDYYEMQTTLFTMFILFQLCNAFNSRELLSESILKNMGKNKIMLITFGLVFLLQIVITQFGGSLFMTKPLSVLTWCKIMLTAVSIIVVNEIYKLIYRKSQKLKLSIHKFNERLTRKQVQN